MSILDSTKNFAKVTVSTGYDDTAVSITLISGDGNNFPAVPFNAVWWNFTDYADPSDDPLKEIVRVTVNAADVVTVTRAQESTAASVKNVSGKVYKMLAGLTKLTMDAIDAALSVTSPLTTKGDLYGFSTLAARVPIGTNGQVLTADSAQALGLKWGTPGVIPVTTKGDIFGFSTINDRLPVGTNGQVLSANSVQALGLQWVAANPLTTKGDLIGFSTLTARLAVGTDGQILTADSASSLGIKWAAAAAASAPFSKAESAITTDTITAATHGKGTLPFVSGLDNAVPPNYVIVPHTVAANGDVVVTFAVAFTGTIVIR